MFRNIKNSIITGVFCLSAVFGTGCSAANAQTAAPAESAAADTSASSASTAADDKIKIVCTIFPGYDWAKQILGDNSANADIRYLLDSGTDLHSYQPTASDIKSISECDMFIYVGGESDEWVEDVLDTASNKDMKVIELMALLGDKAKTEELKEGMQEEEEEHDHDHGAEEDDHHHDEDEGHHHEDGEELDEHVWLSLSNARIFCEGITDGLCEIDPGNADTYRADLAEYDAKLKALDDDFRTLVDGSSQKTLIFGDRFPFRYFTDDYGLDYYAAFIGCSAESEASFETIAFLSGKINELDADTVYTIENSDGKIAQSVISASGADCTIAVLDSAQSVSAEDIENGRTYLGIMQSNYDVLKADLSE